MNQLTSAGIYVYENVGATRVLFAACTTEEQAARIVKDRAAVIRLRESLNDMMAVAYIDNWPSATTGRQIIFAAAGEAMESTK